MLRRDLKVLRLIDRSEMTDWGRLFQTIGKAWQNARLVKFRFVLLSCIAGSCCVDAVASMVCKDESVHGGSTVVVSSLT